MEERVLVEEESNMTDKALAFFKRNILNFLLVCVYGLFIFKDLVTIQESGKSIIAIVADTAIAFFMGMATNIIMRHKGQQAAMESASYVSMQKTYSQEIDKSDSHINELDDFCDKKNEIRYVKAQTAILRTERIKYEDFLNKPIYDVCKSKEMEKCWKKAQRVKIQLLTPENLLSETDDSYDKGKKEETLSQHNKKKVISGATTKILMALIFGYFSVSVVLGASMLWSAIQVGIWLMWGIMTYMQEYFYIKQVYQQKIYRKIKYLKEFNNKGE